jgi:GMP synthase (glutamine-hydrolysing)
MQTLETIIILDFGAQTTQLIARRVRELGVFSEIWSPDSPAEKIRERMPSGLILSGGPASVYETNAPQPDSAIFGLGIPILGICYGLQLMAHHQGGQVRPSEARGEFGRTELSITRPAVLFQDLESTQVVWMSHGDRLLKLPDGFTSIAVSDGSPFAAIENTETRQYGVQFHPEVSHTTHGTEILSNFIRNVCGCRSHWNASSFVEQSIEDIQKQVGVEQVICGLSGGVDSSVTALLLHKAIGEQLHCVLVDNALLREGEREEVERVFRHQFGVALRVVDARDRFLKALEGVEDPEQKRKIIGREFIIAFESEAKNIGKVDFLAQGTLYPDLIESRSAKGPSATIKSHHNVGGLPEKMHLKLIEPLKELFKDEVRAVGKELGLSQFLVSRHPFPGPGLGVRIIGSVTKQRLDLLKRADAIFIEELRKAGWYDQTAQALAVLLPVKSVGVMGDERTYEQVIALRAVNTNDFMTADFTRFPWDLLGRIANRIINEVRGINRVVYDISSKPPATVEWE